MRVVIRLLMAALICSAGPAVAQKQPEKIRLSESSRDGAVLIRVPVQPFSAALQFSKNGNSGFMSRVYLMKIAEGEPGFRYIARTLSPGRYRLDSVWQQAHWSVCLESGTFEFDVKAGEIAYLGTLHTDLLFRSLQDQAIASEDTVQRGTSYFLTHGSTDAPLIDGNDEAGLAAARSFAETSMNGTGELVRLAGVNATSFATSGAGKAIQVCG